MQNTQWFFIKFINFSFFVRLFLMIFYWTNLRQKIEKGSGFNFFFSQKCQFFVKKNRYFLTFLVMRICRLWRGWRRRDVVMKNHFNFKKLKHTLKFAVIDYLSFFMTSVFSQFSSLFKNRFVVRSNKSKWFLGSFFPVNWVFARTSVH